MSIINLSAYRFVGLDDLPALRERIHARCEALALKGTILLAPEGINLFLAGAQEPIDAFMNWLREDPRFAGLEPKVSVSDAVPFGRMRVRLKKEIITMRMPAIRPEGSRAPVVAPVTLQRWLAQGRDDEGREVVLLDTRNDYETDVGLFADAVDYRIASFTELPAALAADRARYEGKTVVSYCTGGIRCEKAALHMQDIGMERVYQLEGGILKYFEETDGAHWRGDCFVFDERGALDKNLAPAALLPLPAGERAGVRGQPSESPALGDAFSSTRPLPPSGGSSAPSGHLLPDGEQAL
ncbi:sulfurtransferase [Dyella solisilvae]|uniref:tRNA uridine(34) hydroxylase n=1 Tax=Dyella solisilvae TaxID=1920168 RepID=A0A370K2U4_9GAMM|nr:sulfurtransferase [Dyella solisilvae]RDI96918.1 sulfurtransferase [Dyella solisilvae]